MEDNVLIIEKKEKEKNTGQDRKKKINTGSVKKIKEKH